MLGDLFSKANQDSIGIIEEDRMLTYRDLETRSSYLASHFSDSGVKAGDRVAILLPNCWQFVVALFAAFKLGAIAVPLDFRSSNDEVQYIVKDCSPSIIVSSTERKISIEQKLPFVEIETDPEKEIHVVPKEHRSAGRMDLVETLPAMIIYTSGTTGFPKGVVLTHRNIEAVLRGLSMAWDLKWDKEIFAAVLPMSHSGGLNCNVNSMIFSSGTVVIMRRFRASQLLDLVEKHRITGFAGVPTVYNALVQENDLGRRSLGSLRVCLSSGAPLSDSTFKTFQQRTHVIIEQGWGLTEASPQLTLSPFGVYETNYVGVPISGTEIVAMDENLQPLSKGEVGQLAARGAQIMQGYWKNEAETRKVLVHDGWLLTGDMGYVSDKGVFVLGRKKDTINSGGYKIWPGEVEKILMEHPRVKEAAVIGIPDSYYGEVVKAFVVLRAEITTGELQAFCKLHLGSYKVPKYFEFMDALPKSSVGKVLKRNLIRR